MEWKKIGKILSRSKGMKITASEMKEKHSENGKVKIFAGGKTFAMFEEKDILQKNVIRQSSIIVKSRGIIEFEYYDKPFSHKGEFWSYYSEKREIFIQYVYYFLKKNEPFFQKIASKMQMPQISIPDTDNFIIPIPPIKIQKEIVAILDKLDKLVNDISEGLPAEIKARRKQYEYYREKLLTFKKLEK